MDDTLIYQGGAVKALGGGKVGGYLVRFGGPDDTDAEGEYFAPDTDFGEADTTPIIYHHGMDTKLGPRRLGQAQIGRDDVGVWLEGQMAMADEYERAIYEMAEAGKLGWSSGTASHLVQRAGSKITSWPLGIDASLTPTPAEYRNRAIALKSLITPERAEAATTAPEGDEAKPKQTENKKMDDITKIVDERIAALEATKAAERARAEALEQAEQTGYQKAVKELETGGLPGFAVKRVTKLGLADDDMAAFRHWIKTGDEGAVKAALQVGTDEEGGYLVPNDFYNRVVEKRNQMSWVRQAPVTVFSTSRDAIDVPTEGTSMTAFAQTAEEVAYNQNEPTFGQVRITLYKYTKLVKVSDELISDQAANLDAFLAGAFARAWALTENTVFTNGTGSGAPQGLYTAVAAGTTSVTAASATAVTAGELASLIGALGEGYNVPADCGFLATNVNKWKALTLQGSDFLFIPTPNGGMQTGPYGYPIYGSDLMPAQTTGLKPWIFGNFQYYGIAERQTLTVTRNPYLYEANGQVGLFARFRIGGARLQADAFKYLTMA